MALAQNSDQPFLSNKELLEIRTLSTTLSWLESLIGGQDVPYSGYAKVSDGLQTQHKLLNNFLQTINRGGSNVITLVPSTITSNSLNVFSATSDESFKMFESDCDLYRSQNPQHDEFDELAENSRNITYRVKLVGRAKITPDFTEDPLGFYVRLLKNKNYKIPFALVAELSLTLLKHGQTASTKEG